MIEPNDPNWDRLTERAAAARADPAAWLAMRDIYGATADAPAFARGLRPLAPRPVVRRHRGDAPPLPRMTRGRRSATRARRRQRRSPPFSAPRSPASAPPTTATTPPPSPPGPRTRPPRPSPPGSPTRRPAPARRHLRRAPRRRRRRAAARASSSCSTSRPGPPARGCGTALLAAAEAWLRAVGAPPSASRARRPPATSTRARGYAEVGAPIRRPAVPGLPDASSASTARDGPRHLRLRRRPRRQRADLAPPAARDPRRRRPPPLAGRGGRALPRPLARLDPRDRRPRVRRHRHRRRPRRHAPRPLRRLPRRARAHPPRRRGPRRARLPLLRRLLLPARARRAVAHRHRPLAALRGPCLLGDDGPARQARPRPLPFRRRNPSAILPPPASSSRTVRPA